MAGYETRREDSYITGLPSPPYSEDGNDNDERTRFKSEHFDHILNRGDLNKKSVPHKIHKTIPKNKVYHPNKFLQKNFMHSIKNYVKEKENKTELGSSSKNKLASIYPNLMNLNNPNIVNAESQVTGSPTKSSYFNKKVRCYVCNQNVDSVHLKDHLLFGTLQCSDCGWKEDDCYSFRKFFRNKRKITDGCNHEEQRWLSEPLTFLTNCFVTKNRFSLQNKKLLLDEHLEHYMSSIVNLWDIKPWDSAIDLCRIYLSSIIPKNSQSVPSYVPEPKKAKKGTHLLDLPVDGRYYISKEVIEECRDCYSKLNINDFQFYVSTALITTSCRNCDLPIYFVLTPPNSAKPFLEITLS